jgi:archaellum component FlaC
MAKNSPKPTTIEDLARMINAGFNDVTNDIGEVKQDMTEVKQRLGRIEHLLLAEQKREIEDLKTRMKRLEDALAV